VFELDRYEEEQNYILVVRKLEMHGNQKTTYSVERECVDLVDLSLLPHCLNSCMYLYCTFFAFSLLVVFLCVKISLLAAMHNNDVSLIQVSRPRQQIVVCC